MAKTEQLSLLTVEDVVTSSLARWGIYSDNGVGKTTLISTIPRNKKVLVVSADQENVKPLRGHQEHIRVYKMSRWDELDDILRLLQSKQNPFDVCVFDTWSRIQGLCINHIVGYELVEAGKEAEYMTRHPKLPKDWKQWQDVGALMGEWMFYLCTRAPVHLLFLMQEHTREIQEGDEKFTHTSPALTPYGLGRTKEILELIGRMYVDVQSPNGNTIPGGLQLTTPSHRDIDVNTAEKRMLLIGKHQRYFSKGDSLKLGYVIEDPSWNKLATTLE